MMPGSLLVIPLLSKHSILPVYSPRLLSQSSSSHAAYPGCRLLSWKRPATEPLAPMVAKKRSAPQREEQTISGAPVITPETQRYYGSDTKGCETNKISTEKTAPRGLRAAILWDLDNKNTGRSSPFSAAQGLRQVIEDKYGSVNVMAAYGKASTLDFVPRDAINEAKDEFQRTLLDEEEIEPAEPYRCSLCGAKCTTTEKLQKHVKALHERERRKKISHINSAKRGTKRREKLHKRHENYLGAYTEVASKLMPQVNYDLGKELTRAMVDVRRVGDYPEAADLAPKAHTARLCYPREQDGAQGRAIDCLVLVSDDTGFTKMLNKAKRAGVKTVHVGGKCQLRRIADEHISWDLMLEEMGSVVNGASSIDDDSEQGFR